MIDDWIRQSDTFRRRLGRILDIRYPSVLFGQKVVSREQRSCMPIWTHPKENEIKDRKPRRIFLCEFFDELFLVGISELFEVIDEGDINGVDVFLGDWNFVEELV